MRSRKRDDVTPVGRWALRIVTAALGVAAATAGLAAPAFASTGQLAAPSASTFGILGPVGIVAVGVGVVGMIAGLARRRRDALASAVAARGAAADKATAERAARVAARESERPRSEQPIPTPSRPPAVERAERTLPLPAVHSTRAA